MAPVGETVSVDGNPVPAADFPSFGGGLWNFAYVNSATESIPSKEVVLWSDGLWQQRGKLRLSRRN